MNLDTYRTRIKQVLGLNADDHTLIDGWVNDGVIDFIRRTHCNVNCADLTTSADVWKYTLPSSVMAMKEIWRDGSDVLVVPVDPTQITRMRTASPQVADSFLYYALEGSDLLMLYPTPADSYELDVFYVPYPTAMAVTSDSPTDIPVEYHTGPELYALWRGADYRDDDTSKQGLTYREQYLEYVQETIRSLNRKQGQRMPVARTSRRGLLTRRRRDVYP